MGRIAFQPIFVKTKNVRNFEVMMDGLALAEGEGALGLVHGRAGRGKTRTAVWWHGQHGGIYLRVLTVWQTSERAFLQSLCRELGARTPPSRKDACFAEAVDRLLADPRPVFLDEIEKLPERFLSIVRDLSDLSGAPFVLIGEEELLPWVRRERRVWSRTFQVMEFEPIAMSDIVYLARDACGLALTEDAAAALHRASGGDFRLVKRDLLLLVQMANAKKTTEITGEMAKTAVKMGLRGE